jgi:hypothetical protein
MLNRFIVVWLAIFLSLPVWGETIWVDTTGNEGQKLQDAVNSADTVILEDGVYHLAINDTIIDSYTALMGLKFRSGVVMKSANGYENCILSAKSEDDFNTAGHVIYCDSIDNGRIEGLTIQDGSADIPVFFGGGIYLRKSSPSIVNCGIQRNYAGWGGGLYLESSNSVIESCIIENNSALNSGGGVIAYDSSDFVIENSVMDGNYARHGGGIFCSVSSLIVRGCFITNNRADYPGGGVYAIGASNVVLEDNVISDNWANDGGGVNYVGSTVILRRCLISGNVASYGGGIAGADSTSHAGLHRCTFIDNFGGAIWITLNASMDVDSSLFLDNYGVAILSDVYNDVNELSINNSNLYFNTFQPDTEIYNYSAVAVNAANNFWWFTEQSEISALFYGGVGFSPFSSTMFTNGIPCEPIRVDSVRNYIDGTYSQVTNSVDKGGRLYIRVYGEDANKDVREAAMVILRSNVYQRGIGVALAETEAGSGIFEGSAYTAERTINDTSLMLSDDIGQTIGVDALGDSIFIESNTGDASFIVIYGIVGVEENNNKPVKMELNVFPTIVAEELELVYYSPRSEKISITVYDVAGKRVKVLQTSIKEGRNKLSLQMDSPAGLYFIRLSTQDSSITRKVVKLR